MDLKSEKSIGDSKQKEAERSYGCPCGKTYLSYPALFTHVKQKHEGKAPGKLVKPKSGKIRGRPKTRINPEDVQLLEIMNKIEQSIPELVQQCPIQYQLQFERSQGSTTCQDAATNFIDHFQNLGDHGISVLSCFLNQVKNAVQVKFGSQYWAKQKPAQIIQIANILYIQYQESTSQFPIAKQIFKQLIYNFFQWLYAHKFTDHRLLKRIVHQEDKTKTNQ